MYPCSSPHRQGSRFGVSLFVLLILSLALLTGCGGDKNEEVGESLVLATVGENDITAAQYEEGLAKLEEKELPRGEDGLPVDTATLEGKRAFLQVLINKELLSQMAYQLGYDQEPEAQNARMTMVPYHAVNALWEEVVGTPSRNISDEELADFYANMGKVRKVNYVITNFQKDAEKARDLAKSGADWSEVVDQFHDGRQAQGEYIIQIPFGQYRSEFDNQVFNTPIGGVTEPVRSKAGYWVMRILEEEQQDKPELEQAKAKILDTMYNRKVMTKREEFRAQLRQDYKLNIDEEVLWLCYQGIAEGGLMDPKTKAPRQQEDLEPLDVNLKDLDRVFYSYEMGGELIQQTLGDYKGHFDNMSVFQRPKRSDMLGGLREKISFELERSFLSDTAEKRGLFEKPEVQALVDEKIEEIMVTNLYKDLVNIENRVTPEELQAFWDEHKSDYAMPENREGRFVFCVSEAEALQAKAELEQGGQWPAVLKKYGTEPDNKSNGGRVPPLRYTEDSPESLALFKLDIGQVSQPFPASNGRYAVAVLDRINPPTEKTMLEMSEALGQRIRNQRKEKAFQDLLDEWTAQLGVTIHEENLEGLQDWVTVKSASRNDGLQRVRRN